MNENIPPSFGLSVAKRIHQEKERAIAKYGRFTLSDAGKIIDDEMIRFVVQIGATVRPKRVQKPNAPDRKRNELFDILATACGINLKEITPPLATTIGTAIADIKQASPDVTTEEIQRRVNAYKAKYRDGANLTPKAVAAHWAEFPRKIAPSGPVGLPEPEGWLEWVDQEMPGCVYGSDGLQSGTPWARMERVAQEAIIKGMGQ